MHFRKISEHIIGLAVKMYHAHSRTLSDSRIPTLNNDPNCATLTVLYIEQGTLPKSETDGVNSWRYGPRGHIEALTFHSSKEDTRCIPSV